MIINKTFGTRRLCDNQNSEVYKAMELGKHVKQLQNKARKDNLIFSIMIARDYIVCSKIKLQMVSNVKCTVVAHLLLSSNLVSSNLWLLLKLKEILKGQYFVFELKVEIAMHNLIKAKQETRMGKWMALNDDYVENKLLILKRNKFNSF